MESEDIVVPEVKDLHLGREGDVINDSDDALEVTVPLQDDDLRAGQLGTQIYRNLAEAQLSEPRDLVTAQTRKRVFYFQARYRYARYGTYQGRDACLIVLAMSFQQYSDARFKAAEIEIDFEDAQNVGLNPYEDDIDLTHQPRVLDFEPKEFHGPVSQVTGTNKIKLDVPISAPGGFIGVTPGLSQSKDFIREGNFKVHGVVKEDPPSSLHWVLREDKIKKGGIRSEMSVAMIVSYTPNRKFAARVRLKADIFLPFLRPMCGAKDDPIFFDPEYMKANRQPLAATSLHTGSAVVPGIQAEELDHEDLKEMTRLSALGGIFVE